MLEIIDPFINEVRRHIAQTQTEEIVHLGRENGQRDTCRKAHDNRVGNELDHRSQMRYTHQYQQDTRHHGSDHQTAQTELLDDTIDNNDECTGRTAYLHFTSSENGNQQTGDDRRYQTFRRTNTRRDTKRDG